MNPVRIAVIDDQPKWVRDMIRTIGKAATGSRAPLRFVTISEPKDQQSNIAIGHSLSELLHEFSRVIAKPSMRGPIIRALDGANLVLVDYNLKELPGDEGLVTGERIAQLVRYYTKSGPIVSVNRRPVRLFELDHRSTPATHADFTFKMDDLGSRSLWDSAPHGYAPWHWPNLMELAQQYENRVDFVREHWERPVTKSLGFPKDVEAVLPLENTNMPLDLRRSTFQLLANKSIPDKVKVPLEYRHRVAASSVGSWMQSLVLPPQDIFLDAPHLIRHCPSLLKGRPLARTLTSLVAKRVKTSLPLKREQLRSHEFALGFWLDRPVWWTSGIQHDEKIDDIARPWDKRPLQRVFAEDSSRFLPPERLKEYESDGFFSTRYVEGPEVYSGVDYQPASRLAT